MSTTVKLGRRVPFARSSLRCGSSMSPDLLRLYPGRRYQRGTRLEIQSHEPPLPNIEPSVTFTRDALKRNRKKTHAQLSRLYPPSRGRKGPSSLTIEITGAIRSDFGHCTQLLKVVVPDFRDPSKHLNLVAKIFDPFLDTKPVLPTLNPFALADHTYCTEAAAYRRLTSVQGTLVPKFYGSYTCMLPTGLKDNLRPVRIILLELLNGVSLDVFEQRDVRECLSQKARKNVMYKVVDTDSRIYKLGVDQDDQWARNSFLVYPENFSGNLKDMNTLLESSKFDLRLLDFGFAKLAPFSVHYERLFEYEVCKPDRRVFDSAISPIVRWHIALGNFQPYLQSGWVDWPWQNWLQEMFGDPTIYESVTKEMIHRWLGGLDLIKLSDA